MTRSLTILWILALFSASAPAMTDPAAEEVSPQIHVQADMSEYDPVGEQFTASGNVRVTYEDVLLTADTVSGDGATGDIEALGGVTFQSEGRSLTGESFTYNFKTKVGNARNASASIDNIFFRGEELKSEPGRYTVTGSSFTTCNAEKPHYHLSARELVIEPGKKLLARDVGIVLFGNRLIRVPKYSMGLSGEKESKSTFPAIGISGRYGIYAGYELDLATGPRTIGTLDVRLSTREVLQGGLMYDRLAGRPVFLRATYKQPFYGGGRSDLMVSRLPEIGVRFSSGRAAGRRSSAREPLDLSRGLIDPLRPASPGIGLNVIGELGVGKLIEEPHQISSERVDGRVVAWLDPVGLDSRTLVSPGVSARLSHYGGGDDYSALGFRLAVARRLGTDSFASLTYVTHSIHGQTPFEFDKIELADELAGRIRFPAGSVVLELGGRYDLRGHRFFDTEISVAKTMHCLEPKLTWRNRFQEFSVDVGLVGF